jgi:hypothetical protein
MIGPGELTRGDLSPILRQQFRSVVTAKKAAERRNTLAILKILELIVSGRMPQQAGEDFIDHLLTGSPTTLPNATP